MSEAFSDNKEKGPVTTKSVSLTGQENIQMFMGDPQSPETKAIMKKHDINFGDTVVVNVEGQQPMVVNAGEADFWTRDKEASGALAAPNKATESTLTDLEQAVGGAKAVLGEIPSETLVKHEAIGGEVIEPLGEEALQDTLENAETFNKEGVPRAEKAEVIPPLGNAEIVAMIEKNRKMLDSQLDSYKSQNGYNEADHGGKTLMEKAAESLNELMSRGEPRSAEEKAYLADALTRIARDIDNNIVGAFEPLDTRAWEKVQTDYLADTEDTELTTLSEHVNTLIGELKHARQQSSSGKNMAVSITEHIKTDLQSALINGRSINDQLYGVVRQMQQALGQESSTRRSVANVRLTLKTMASNTA
jgi:hypothetical protein